MAKKKTSAKRTWFPAAHAPGYTQFNLRLPMSDADLIQDAAEAEAARMSIPLSRARNGFCLRAMLAAAKKELGQT
jgi:uncharacterized protein (DUF1778 family)